jgi:osmotically-inducible protein OsmY
MKKLLPLVSLGALTAWFLKSKRVPAAVTDRIPSGVADRLPGTSTAPASSPASGDPATFAGNPDDQVLHDKVETELFRDADVPKGDINVNVEFGKVVLRGEVESRELIDDLVIRVRAIEGVNDVESLLHVPGEPAPMHE